MSESLRAPQCVLGNGECPPACDLYTNSQRITEALGDDFDADRSRALVLFADAREGVDVVHIARVVGLCKLEPLRDRQSIEIE